MFKLFGFLQDKRQLNTKGIGLGLVISQQIVSKFNGKVSFTSEEGVGSTFTFTFELGNELERDENIS
jgi:signal transduction histidine kinase